MWLNIAKAYETLQFGENKAYAHNEVFSVLLRHAQTHSGKFRFWIIEEVTLFNKVRSSGIRKSLNIELLLLRIERSLLRWFGHVRRMPQERLPKQALHAKANGRRPVGRPRTRWTDYIDDLGWNRLGLRPSEMIEVMKGREVWRLNLELLPPHPSRKSGQWRKKKKMLSLELHEKTTLGSQNYAYVFFEKWNEHLSNDTAT